MSMDDLFKDTDLSCSSLEENLKACQKKSEDFHRQLDDFSHSFQLENRDRLLVDQLNKVRRSLQSALEVGYKTPVETARARNLLAFVLFLRKRPTEALQETQLALNTEGEHHNIVSLANKAVILWHQGQRYKAQEIVQKLHTLKNDSPEFGYLAVKAKAELAFSYTCFDPSFYPLARQIFGEVLESATGPELWLWKFGHTFTRRRQLRPPMSAGKAGHREYMDVLRAYLDIVENCSSGSLRAKVFAEVALLLFMPCTEDVRKELEKAAGLTVLQACDKALELDDNDISVLWKCGKLFRYLCKTELVKSRVLLERAVAIRPTSKAYHHLGLTYQALAKQEKQGKSIVRQTFCFLLGPATVSWLAVLGQSALGVCSRIVCFVMSYLPFSFKQNTDSATVPVATPDRVNEENYRTFMTQKSEVENSKSESLSSSKTEPDVNRTGSTDASNEELKTLSTAKATQLPNKTDEKDSKETFEIWKIAKSPLKSAILFSRKDRYVEETLEALQKAVEMSEWENAVAAYELALMHRGLDELEQAKGYLEKILSKEHCLGIYSEINAYEQLGLVLRDMAEKHAYQNDRNQLLMESQSMLLMALKTASEQYSKSPTVKDHIGDIWHSFHTLLQAVADKGHSESNKLREKARLFQLISDHTQSLAFLQEIALIEPQKANDPEYLKLCIENHVALQQYNEALIFVDLLQCTTQRQKVLELFDDSRYLHKVCLLAAQESLLRSSPNFKSHFRDTFIEYVAGRKLIATSSEDIDTGAKSDLAKEDDSKRTSHEAENATWDVLILHEDHEKDSNLAAFLTNIFTVACGLKVTRSDDDVMPNEPILDGLLRVMKRSSLVLVIFGQNEVSGRLSLYLNHAARRGSSLTLLVNDAHVPNKMKTHRFLDLPAELLQVTSAADCEKFAQDRVAAVCKLFSFLIDIDFGQISEP